MVDEVKAVRAPAIFVGHGSPSQAITGVYRDVWQKEIGARAKGCRAILCISAHWYTRGTAIDVSLKPKTIHDFGGFPREFYQVQYPAPGAPWLAQRVGDLAGDVLVHQDASWGYDHGSWSVLMHALPEANIPVVQLSIDGEQGPAFHYELGRRLAPLRDEGVMILGSGVLTHNLRALIRDEAAPIAPWAKEFLDVVKGALDAGDDASLIDYPALPHGMMAAPTPDHYLPLLYVLGARNRQERPHVFNDVVEYGSLGMLSVSYG